MPDVRPASATFQTVVLIPTQNRPHLLAGLVENIEQTCDARILFLPSPGDLDTVIAVARLLADPRVFLYCSGAGTWVSKLNAGFDLSSEPFVFCGADDLTFHPGWLERALERMRDPIRIVGTNDLFEDAVLAGTHSTHFLVDRRYWMSHRFPDGYHHYWVDKEIIGRARHEGVFVSAADSVVEHRHPAAGKAPWDANSDWANAHWDEDIALYRSRCHEWGE